jgi:nitronate monooxygenase
MPLAWARFKSASSSGIGFITWRLEQQPDLLELVLDHTPKAIFLSFGDLRRFAPVIAASSSLFIAQVQSLDEAKSAADLGADIIVAQGSEAGGHGGSRATFPLVPAVVDAVGTIPVVAAGGIADGRRLAAALMLGASGVVMGTRFYCSRESLAPDDAKARALTASVDHTIRSSVFDVLHEYDWPSPYRLRTLNNRMTDKYANDLEGLRSDKRTQIARFEQGLASGDYDIAPIIVGEAVDLINDLPSAAAIVAQTVLEATARLCDPVNFKVGG